MVALGSDREVLPADDRRDPRYRLRALFDDETFRPFADELGTGMTAAYGRIGRIPVVAFASDPRIRGGALGRDACDVVTRSYDVALRERLPIIGLWHSGGALLSEGAESLHGVGRIFAAMTRASGVVPQVSVVLGPAAGGAAYGPALTDVVIISDVGRLFVTGPDVVRSVTGEEIDMAALGGPEPHSRCSGVAHIVTATEAEAFEQARRVTELLSHPGRVNLDDVKDAELGDTLPETARRAYDVHPLIDRLLDQASSQKRESVELHPLWAPNLVTVLGRFGGRAIGVIANNPIRLGGCLDALSAEKASRFVRMCDAFGIPLIVIVDVPGYLPGRRQEWDGVVRRGAKLLHAFAEATVPRVTLVTRKAYGGAYIAMNSRALGAARVLAWPTAEISVMGPAAAVRILHRKHLALTPEDQRPAVEADLAAEYESLTGGVQRAVELGVVDEVISPGETRRAIARALCDAPPARGAHGNIPL